MNSYQEELLINTLERIATALESMNDKLHMTNVALESVEEDLECIESMMHK